MMCVLKASLPPSNVSGRYFLWKWISW